MLKLKLTTVRLLILLSAFQFFSFSAFSASTTTVNFSVRTVTNIPITNALIAITALHPVINDGVTNFALGLTVQIRTGANGAVQTNLIAPEGGQLYLFQFRNSIPYYSADTTNLIPATNITVNASDTIVSVSYIPSQTMAYSQTQADGRFLPRTNSLATNSFANAGRSNVLIAPRIFPTIDLAPTTVGYVLSFATTSGVVSAISAAGLGDVTTSQLLGASNSLWLNLTNYDNFSSNYLYGLLTNNLARTTNGLWLEITNRIAITTNGLWAIIADATNSAVLRASNIVVAATNSTTSDLQARLNATNTIYLTRFGTIEASIVDFMVKDDVNVVDYTLWFIGDGVSDLWHVDATSGTDGGSNPDLISRIGEAETLTAKTLTSPTINGGAQNGPEINSAIINTPAINGGTLSSPSITTPTFTGPLGILAATNTDPTFIVRANGAPADTALMWKSIGGTNVSGQSNPVVQITTAPTGYTGGRTWDFQWLRAADYVYLDKPTTIATLGDITTASNNLVRVQSGVANDLTSTNLHVLGNIIQTNGAFTQMFSVAAPTNPPTQGATYWNDGTNVCVVFRNGAGTLTTNKLTMSAWP